MNSNVVGYKELEADLASKLESQYQYLMISGDVLGAYQVLGKLMRYKLIDKFDDRLDSKNKLFSKYGIAKDARFAVDLRKDSNYIPEWLFADIPYYFKSNLMMNERIGERRDFGYVVGVVLPRREIEVEFRLLNTSASAKNTVEELAQTYKTETGRELNIKSILEEVEVGYSRIYDIKINSVVMTKYKKLGYVLVFRSNKDGLFHAKIILKSTALTNSYIDIGNACKVLRRDLENNLNLPNVQIAFLADYRKQIVEQNKLVSETRAKLKDINKARAEATEIRELNRQNNKK